MYNKLVALVQSEPFEDTSEAAVTASTAALSGGVVEDLGDVGTRARANDAVVILLHWKTCIRRDRKAGGRSQLVMDGGVCAPVSVLTVGHVLPPPNYSCAFQSSTVARRWAPIRGCSCCRSITRLAM